MKYKKIALIGMMGSGKSTIAKELSKKTGLELLETDEIFELKYKTKIKDFFKNYGENKFRKLETELLKEISQKENFILSTGGGIILQEENRKILFNTDIKTIYLKANFETIFERIKNSKERPLLLVENPKKEIQKILKSRECFYKIANKTIITDNKTIEEITKEIIAEIWIK